MSDITVEEIVALVNEIDQENHIDWSRLSIDNQLAIELMANNLLEQYNNSWSKLDSRDQALTMLAVMAHLVTENFSLNLRLRQ
jgi:hypothetical protein